MRQFVNFVLMRAAMAVFTLFLVSLIVFTLMEMVPGDCAERYLAYMGALHGTTTTYPTGKVCDEE